MTPWLVLGSALGVLFLPFAVVGAMYWMVFFLRALHGLRASMRAFQEEAATYRLWHERRPAAPAHAVPPPPDYGPEPLTPGPPSVPSDAELDATRAEAERRRRFPGLPPWPQPDAPLDTDFQEPARPAGDYDDFSDEGPEPVVAPGSKLAASPPPAPRS